MYKEKTFRIRTREEIFEDLAEMAAKYGSLPIRVFLADGDALVLPTEFLLEILSFIKTHFPFAERVTSYGTARDVNRKSIKELQDLRQAGLQMVYIGAESGASSILEKVRKNITTDEMVLAAEKLRESGIQSSVTFISGLGGRECLKEHAIGSAKLTSQMNPDYVGFLTLMLEEPAPIIKEIKEKKLTLLSPDEVIKEMTLYLNNVDSPGTIFRANHASNYVILKGTLNKDIPHMLGQLEEVERHAAFRKEQWRSL